MRYRAVVWLASRAPGPALWMAVWMTLPLTLSSSGCQLPEDLGLGGDAGTEVPAPGSDAEGSSPVVLWANGLRGSCRGMAANMQAAMTIAGSRQLLYGPGYSTFLSPGPQTIELGSGVTGCRNDYGTFQLTAEDNHVYLLTAWGDPTNFSDNFALVDITNDLRPSRTGAVLVNLSTLLPSVEFLLGSRDSYVVFAPGYLVVPGAIQGPIVAAPEAEPSQVAARPSSSHYQLVLYRDNSDGTAAELTNPASVPSPP